MTTSIDRWTSEAISSGLKGQRQESLRRAIEAAARTATACDALPPNLRQALLPFLESLRVALSQSAQEMIATQSAPPCASNVGVTPAGVAHGSPTLLDTIQAVAGCFDALALSLPIAGHQRHAIVAAQYAVDCRRSLWKANPELAARSLGASLVHLGRLLASGGELKAAARITQEGVDVSRAQAEVHHDDNLPELASWLIDLSARQSECRYRDRAIESAEEACRLYRRVAGNSEGQWLDLLAASLENLGVRLSESASMDAALEAMHQGMRICRDRAHGDREGTQARLASILTRTGEVLRASDRSEEARPLIQEAIHLWRIRLPKDPVGSAPGLASSLSALSDVLAEQLQWVDALAARRESVEVYRLLAGVNPERFEYELASALHRMGRQSLNANHVEEAIACSTEAASMRRALAAGGRDDHAAELLRTLELLAEALNQAGRRDEAEKIREEGAVRHRRLFEE